MNETTETSFRTVAGTCTITPEQIVMERHGVRGSIGKWIWGNNIKRAFAIYGFLGILMMVIGILLVINEHQLIGTFLFAVGSIFIVNVYMSRNASATQIIERSSIQSVEARPPRLLLTRGYFTVWFLENGDKRKRFIMLPGIIFGGKKEYRRALSVMQKEGLIEE